MRFDNLLQPGEHLFPVCLRVLGSLFALVVVLAQREVRLSVVVFEFVHKRVVILGRILLATQWAEVSELEPALVLDLQDLALVLVLLALVLALPGYGTPWLPIGLHL